MLRLRRDLFEAMLAHCRAEHPIEACGVLPGPRGGDVPDRIVPMLNAEQSREAYRFDPDEQLLVWQDMFGRGERPVVIYHSHTATGACPSATDIRYATVPEAHYVVVSTRQEEDKNGTPDVRSYRIRDGQAVAEPIVIG